MHRFPLVAATLFAWAIPFDELCENLYLQGRIDDETYSKMLARKLAADDKTGPP